MSPRKNILINIFVPFPKKIAKEFIIIEQHVKPAMLKKIAENQNGAIPTSSTTYAQIRGLHSWTKHPE